MWPTLRCLGHLRGQTDHNSDQSRAGRRRCPRGRAGRIFAGLGGYS
ncbi:hypothetical protein HMPREF1979_01373 [Actinomyces johnsonii F0542]|uniref:Uncharacterized protein n=1 Tax=Actinomyces johnsonii F0542 TaxID=1321818 RepID=U1S0W5_9ACTO|nr:hypothetical protein HMPREF1979_01373 [Actinomyces johnsonii F0542]